MADRSRVKVLVVDDEPTIRESLSEFLADFDFQVFAARDGASALEILKADPCQVAIVDLRLPGMSSERLVLGAAELVPGIRFLIHTGSVDYTLPPEFTALGIRSEHVIRKPSIRLVAFVEAIDQLVAEGSDGNQG